jgi:hypothetical protein
MRTSPKTNPVMACDYDDEGLSGSVNPSGSGSGAAVVQDDEEEGERKRKRKTNSGGAKKKDVGDTASLLKRIRMSPFFLMYGADETRGPRSTDQGSNNTRYGKFILDLGALSYCLTGSAVIYRRSCFR